MQSDEPRTTKYCPDCDAEQPISEFYRLTSATSPKGYRYSDYCKTHTKARNAATRKNAPRDGRLRETRRRLMREWARKHPENARRNSANCRQRKKQRRLDHRDT